MKSFKVIVIGNTNTGKTSIINRYTQGTFQENFFATILPVQHSINSQQNCQLNIWDTAGMEEWQSMNEVVYHNVDAVMLISAYDNQKSLYDLENFWIPKLNDYIDFQKVPIFFVVNKSDLAEDEKCIDDNEIDQINSEINAFQKFIVSAKNSSNISQMFEAVSTKMMNRNNISENIVIDPTICSTNKEKKGCC